LDAPVTTVEPLTPTHTAPKTGQQLTLAGWGSKTATKTGTNPKPATRLQQGTVTIAKVDATTVGVRGTAPEATTSACTYDSGAPYFTGTQLVALESTGPDCPHAGIETTSRTDILTNWLTKTTR
jgi:hypothetical protein